jgi:sterol desaturase/sphingolipid hydroxylase (fatty acid hydroxylase superfamily)
MFAEGLAADRWPMHTPRPFGLDLQFLLVFGAAGAIAFEMILLRYWRRRVDAADVAKSIVFGLSWAGVRVIGGKVALFGVWLWTWQHLSLFEIDPRDPWAWVAYFVAGDFLYYWTHRLEHRVRAFWCSHLVHHSSEQFNLATAVRQSWTEVFYKPIIALWAPLLGFHPVMYVTVGAISLAIGQWQHLEWFGKHRVLDAILMSPSNHRVHHGRNPRYVDRNFGGGMVIWDRVFSTYEPEAERAEFGVIHLPDSDSMIEESMGGWPELVTAMRADGSVRGSMRLALGRPV